MGVGQWIGDLAPEPEPPQESRWIAKPRKPPSVLATGVGFGLGYQIPNMLRMFIEGVFGRTAGWVFFGLSLLLIFAFVGRFSWAHRRRLRMTPMDQALIDGGFGDQFPAELTIVVDNKAIGSDRGAVWFADGLMGFSGSAASFVLASRDVEVREPGRDHPRSGQPYPAGTILLRGAPREAYVVVSPLSGHKEGYYLRLKRFQDEFASSDAERFWPPLKPYVEETPALEAAVGR